MHVIKFIVIIRLVYLKNHLDAGFEGMRSFGRNRNNSPFSIGEEEELIGMLEGFSLLNQGLGRARFLNYVK